MLPRSASRRARERALTRSLGPTIRARRTVRRLSVIELAGAARMDPSLLSKVERCKVGVSASTYLDIEKALGWGPGQLFFVALDSRGSNGRSVNKG